MVKLTILWYDNFGENKNPLQRNGMAAIPKMKNPNRKLDLETGCAYLLYLAVTLQMITKDWELAR